MSSLADRLEAARRARVYAVPDHTPTFETERAQRRNGRAVDPFAGVKDRCTRPSSSRPGPPLRSSPGRGGVGPHRSG